MTLPTQALEGRVRRLAVLLITLLCVGQIVWVIVGFRPEVKWGAAAFVAANAAIGLGFVGFFRFSAPWPFYLLMYSVYWMVYVLKGVAQYALNFNTFFSWVTIQTTISNAAYLDALRVVTLGHLVLALMLVLLSHVTRPVLEPVRYRGWIPAKDLAYLLFGVTVWIVLSSAVMQRFGVAVMGSSGVSLPYKMSAVLFYSRLIVLPLILLYCVERSATLGSVRILRMALLAFIVLAASEVIVRASKSPPLIMVLQLAFLDLYLRASGQQMRTGIQKRGLVVILIAAVALWPISEVYRAMLVDRSFTGDIASAVTQQLNRENASFLVLAAQGFYERLLGFLQAAGLVADGGRHDPAMVLSYGGIAQYYTHHYLGYTQEGHLSSPSLIGTSLIVGGASFWPLVFSAYVAVMALVWRAVDVFTHLRVPVACFVAFEATNTIMSGVVDESFMRLGLVFASAVVLEFLFRSLERPRLGDIGA